MSDAASLGFAVSPGDGASALGADPILLGGSLLVLSVGSVLALGGLGPSKGLVELLAWLGGGAILFGIVGWAAAAYVLASVPTIAGLIAGLAAGGGFGATVRLFASAEDNEDAESVTVDMEEKDTVPDPQPMDLFSANPDPILYYGGGTDDPVVRAANPAFEDQFDGDDGLVENQALGSALPIDDPAAVVDAVTAGSQLDTTVTAPAGSYRVRVVPVAGGRSGYVLLTARE
jgi:hypothetical protein